MIDFATHRRQLHTKIAVVRASRAPLALLEAEGGCAHDWRRFKQTVRPQDRSYVQLQLGMDWKGHQAYFVVLGCERCKTKRIIDYVVEK